MARLPSCPGTWGSQGPSWKLWSYGEEKGGGEGDMALCVVCDMGWLVVIAVCRRTLTAGPSMQISW